MMLGCLSISLAIFLMYKVNVVYKKEGFDEALGQSMIYMLPIGMLIILGVILIALSFS